MKRSLYPLWVCLLLAWPAWATSVPYSASFILSAPGGTYGPQAVLVVDGPQGPEQFGFGFLLGAWTAPFVNSHGVVVGNAEAYDSVVYTATYAGIGNNFQSKLGFLHWETPQMSATFPTVTSLTDGGLATATIKVLFGGWGEQPDYSFEQQWQIGPEVNQIVAIPELPAWALLLAGLALGVAPRWHARLRTL